MKKIVLCTFIALTCSTLVHAQIKINNKTDIKISGNNSSNKATVKTKSGEKLSKSASYYYESYEKHLANKHYADAEMALKKVQQKSDKEVDLTAELSELADLKGANNEMKSESNNEDLRAQKDNDRENTDNLKKELDEKYSDIRYNLAKVQKIFNKSSGLDLKEIKEGLAFFEQKNLTLHDIQAMVDDPTEESISQAIGGSNARNDVKNNLLPAFHDVFEKKSEDYNLEKVAEKVDNIKMNGVKALQANQFAAENAEKVEDWALLMSQLFSFTNEPEALSLYKAKTDKVLADLKQSQNEKFAPYRSGEFHRANGSGIYVVQKDGITPATLKTLDITEKIIIDGKSPVHIFVLTDLNIDGYGNFLHFDISDEEKGMNQNKYLFDGDKAVSVDESEKGRGYKKLILVPSADWADLSECYSKSQFYSCYIQEALAKELMPNTPQKFTFYSLNGQLKKTVTIEATPEGLDFLKSMKSKMEKFEIDAARVAKAEASDPNLEAKIKQKFIAENSNVKVIKRIVLTSKPWYVENDAWGNIDYRNCYAQLAYEDTDGNHYIQRVYCTQRYEGGNYQALKVTNRFEARRIREENIHK